MSPDGFGNYSVVILSSRDLEPIGALRQAVEGMGCDVISNTTSLIVLNLPRKLSGKENDLVAGCRAQGFGIWPTLSEPVQGGSAFLISCRRSRSPKLQAASPTPCSPWAPSSTRRM
jgi:hypothetical protein